MTVRFTVTFVPMRGVDGVRALRWLLKAARRRFGLVAVDVREEKPDVATVAACDERTVERIQEQILERHHAAEDNVYLDAGDDHAES